MCISLIFESVYINACSFCVCKADHVVVQREQELGAKRASPALSPREELANRWSDNGGACPA